MFNCFRNIALIIIFILVIGYIDCKSSKDIPKTKEEMTIFQDELKKEVFGYLFDKEIKFPELCKLLLGYKSVPVGTTEKEIWELLIGGDKFENGLRNVLEREMIYKDTSDSKFFESEEYKNFEKANVNEKIVKMYAMERTVKQFEPKATVDDITVPEMEEFAKGKKIAFNQNDAEQVSWIKNQLLPTKDKKMKEEFQRTLMVEAEQSGLIIKNYASYDALVKSVLEIPSMSLGVMSLDVLLYNFLKVIKSDETNNLIAFMSAIADHFQKNSNIIKVTPDNLVALDKPLISVPNIGQFLSFGDILGAYAENRRIKREPAELREDFLKEYKQKTNSDTLEIRFNVDLVKEAIAFIPDAVLILKDFKTLTTIDMLKLGQGRIDRVGKEGIETLLRIAHVNLFSYYLKGIAAGYDKTEQYKEAYEWEDKIFKVSRYSDYLWQKFDKSIKNEEEIKASYEKNKNKFIVEAPSGNESDTEKKTRVLTYEEAKDRAKREIINEKFREYVDTVYKKYNTRINQEFFDKLKLYNEAKSKFSTEEKQ